MSLGSGVASSVEADRKRGLGRLLGHFFRPSSPLEPLLGVSWLLVGVPGHFFAVRGRSGLNFGGFGSQRGGFSSLRSRFFEGFGPGI